MSINEHNEYELSSLNETQLDPDPFVQLGLWLDVADKTEGVAESNAMVVSTVSSDGKPSSRVVLLRGFDANGLTFYTNYESRKGQDLAGNPNIAAVFFWPTLQRSIRVEGTVSKVSTAESDAYFAGRPIKSQMGAVASRQSEVIPNRSVIEDAMSALELQDHIERPGFWGGYRITPTVFEFWQGRRSRLHDRLRYQLINGTWSVDRLSP